jgi:putative FmdB family regulatory protein
MPLYEYKCRNPKCGKEFERLVRHEEIEDHQACPRCKSQECRKLISRTSFSLKGGGWAADGYAG